MRLQVRPTCHIPLKDVISFWLKAQRLFYKQRRTRKRFGKKKITGIVKDEADLPVVGANVIVPRTKKGVITDMNGNFSLEVAAGDEVEISYLGYTT